MDVCLVLLMTSLVLVTSSSSSPPSRVCGDRENVTVVGGRQQSDGSMVAEDGTSFPAGCFWYTAHNKISGCPGKVKPCVHKCCPEHEAIDGEASTPKCIPSTTPLSPQADKNFDFSRFHKIFVKPCYCELRGVEETDGEFVIYDNGTFHEEDPYTLMNTAVPPDSYCYDIVDTEATPELFFFVCYIDEKQCIPIDEKPATKFIINAVCAIISLPFLLATLVVYAVIPELRNLHGKCLMSHVASLCVSFVCLALIQLGVNILPTAGCIATAFILYFSFLASFFWLNVMCFDIWWTFSGYRSRIGPKDPRDKEKFIYYSLYAWGAAVVFLCVCATMQFKKDIPKNYLRPTFGQRSCWFDDKRAKWAYFHGPLAVLIGCNLIFFALTALSLWKIKKQTAVLNEGQDSQRNSQRERNELRFKLYLKLFLVMGVTWVMEIISTIVGGADEIWWITDIANLLVGIPIFIIFVWKSKVRQLFLAKLNIKMGSSTDTSAIELT